MVGWSTSLRSDILERNSFEVGTRYVEIAKCQTLENARYMSVATSFKAALLESYGATKAWNRNTSIATNLVYPITFPYAND